MTIITLHEHSPTSIGSNIVRRLYMLLVADCVSAGKVGCVCGSFFISNSPPNHHNQPSAYPSTYTITRAITT